MVYFVIFVGFGHVYLVKKQGGIDDKKEYAMKLVFPDGYTDREFADAYENEFNVREKLTRNSTMTTISPVLQLLARYNDGLFSL